MTLLIELGKVLIIFETAEKEEYPFRTLPESRRRWNCGGAEPAEWTYEGYPNLYQARCDGDSARYQGSAHDLVRRSERVAFGGRIRVVPQE